MPWTSPGPRARPLGASEPPQFESTGALTCGEKPLKRTGGKGRMREICPAREANAAEAAGGAQPEPSTVSYL